MSIEADVTDAMKAAMRARAKERLTALRNIRAAFLLARKETGAEALSDDEALQVLRKVAKQRKDSISSYAEGGRDDLVAQESAELAVVEEFLPAGPTEATVADVLDQLVGSLGRMEQHVANLDRKTGPVLLPDLTSP